jgi:hypothetical protein
VSIPVLAILSNTMSVIQPTSFNLSKITVSAAKKLDNGSSQAYLNYNGGKLRVQLPSMSVPMDAGDYQGNEKYKVQLSFRDRETNPKVAAYYEMLEKIDDFMISHAMANSGPWFKKPGMSRETAADKYTPCIKIAKDKEGNPKPYPPTQAISLKKNAKTGAFDTELYDKEKRLMEGVTPIDVLRRGAEITALLECTGVWITEKGFGLTWKLFQARVDQTAAGLEPGCAILDDDEEGAPAVPAAATVAKPVVAEKKQPLVVDDDEEADLMAAVKPAAAAPAAAVAPAATDDLEEDEVIEAPPKKAVTTVKKVIKKVVAAK